MLHHLLKTMLLNNWVVQNAMLWRDQHMKTSSEPQSQVSLAASGGSKGLLQDSWSSKKRLPICLLTKKIWGLLSRCSFQKKKSKCVSPILSANFGDLIVTCLRPDRVWVFFRRRYRYLHPFENANPSASIWATGVFAPHSSIAPGTCSRLFHQKMHLVGLNLTSCCE